MLKQEFLNALREGLNGLPQADIEERITFYGEMIDDRIEEGRSEEEAVKEIGTVEAVVQQIVEETPLTRIGKEKIPRPPAAGFPSPVWNGTASPCGAAAASILWAKRWTAPAAAAASTSTGPLAAASLPGRRPPPPCNCAPRPLPFRGAAFLRFLGLQSRLSGDLFPQIT